MKMCLVRLFYLCFYFVCVVLDFEFQIDPHAVLNTGLFSFEMASANRQWLVEPRGAHVPESVEFGISSFVYRRDRPFHPLRLAALLNLDFSTDDDDEDEEDEEDGNDDDEEEEEMEVEKTKTVHKSKSGKVAVEEEDEEDEEDEEEFTQEQLDEAESLFKHVLRSKGLVWIATRLNELVMLQKSGDKYEFALLDLGQEVNDESSALSSSSTSSSSPSSTSSASSASVSKAATISSAAEECTDTFESQRYVYPQALFR